MKIANSGLVYTRRVTQDQEIATSKDMMEDCQSESFCYLKNQLIYPNENSKTIFLYFSFLKREEIGFVLLKNVFCQKINKLSLGIS